MAGVGCAYGEWLESGAELVEVLGTVQAWWGLSVVHVECPVDGVATAECLLMDFVRLERSLTGHPSP